MPTEIHRCGCVSTYQDEKYGPGNRVFNTCKDTKYCRCTVCRKKLQVSSEGEAKKEKSK